MARSEVCCLEKVELKQIKKKGETALLNQVPSPQSLDRQARGKEQKGKKGDARRVLTAHMHKGLPKFQLRLLAVTVTLRREEMSGNPWSGPRVVGDCPLAVKVSHCRVTAFPIGSPQSASDSRKAVHMHRVVPYVQFFGSYGTQTLGFNHSKQTLTHYP